MEVSELLDHLELSSAMCSDGYAECGGELWIAAVKRRTDIRKLCTRSGPQSGPCKPWRAEL
jgi:hypothetical protein